MERLRLNPNYRGVLTSPPNAVTDTVIRTFLTAMANGKEQNPGGRNYQEPTGEKTSRGTPVFRTINIPSPVDSLTSITIGEFKALGREGQLELIDNLYNAISEVKIPNTTYDQMHDPPAIQGNKGPLPSSFRPVRAGQNVFAKGTGLNDTPFKKYGVGFRIDGQMSDVTVNRIKNQGHQAWSMSPGILRDVRGWEVEGTELAKPKIRFWKVSHDIFNESAACVSRNLFGATAFPYRWSTEGGYVLWAVSCLGLYGFDTEKRQLDIPGSRQWRPGEKAFLSIPPQNTIGYVLVDRKGWEGAGGWKFYIRPDAEWTIVNPPPPEVRHYINDELYAWRGHEYNIPPDYDFAT
jgi:hypothetical protein